MELRGRSGRVEMTPPGDGVCPGYKRLAAAILAQAVKDALEVRPWPPQQGPGNPDEARQWLRGIEARDLAAACELDRSLERWLAEGEPKRRGHRRGKKHAEDVQHLLALAAVRD